MLPFVQAGGTESWVRATSGGSPVRLSGPQLRRAPPTAPGWRRLSTQQGRPYKPETLRQTQKGM